MNKDNELTQDEFYHRIANVDNGNHKKKDILKDKMPLKLVLILFTVLITGLYLNYHFNYKYSYKTYAEDISKFELSYNLIELDKEDKRKIKTLSIGQLLEPSPKLTELLTEDAEVLFMSKIADDKQDLDIKDIKIEDIEIFKYELTSDKVIKTEFPFSTLYTLEELDKDRKLKEGQLNLKLNKRLTGIYTENKHKPHSYSYYNGVGMTVGSYLANIHFIPFIDNLDKEIIGQEIDLTEEYLLSIKPTFFGYIMGHMKDELILNILFNVIFIYYLFIFAKFTSVIISDEQLEVSTPKYVMKTKVKYVNLRHFQYLFNTNILRVLDGFIPMIMVTFILTQFDMLYFSVMYNGGYTWYTIFITVIYVDFMVKIFLDLEKYYPNQPEYVDSLVKYVGMFKEKPREESINVEVITDLGKDTNPDSTTPPESSDSNTELESDVPEQEEQKQTDIEDKNK